MKKEEFIKHFDIENKVLISNLFEKIVICEKNYKIKYSELFLTPDIWCVLKNLHNQLPCEILLEGVFREAERKYVIIKPYNSIKYCEALPIKIIKISNLSKYKKLYHRNYLGSLIHLGLKREVFGDLIISEDKCYCPVVEKIAYFVKVNLEKINSVPVKVDILDIDSNELPEYSFIEKVISVSSLRLDAVVASAFNISRGDAVNKVNSGVVIVNYKKQFKKDYPINKNDIITLRGNGKICVMDITGETKKGKLKLMIKIYN